MPIYEYQVRKGYKGCKECKEPFEIMQKITDDPLRKCLKCKSPLEKLISQSTFKLEGECWYRDGYKSKSDKK